MSPSIIQKEIERAGRKLSRWQAQLKAASWTAIALGCLWLFGLYDVFIRFERIGRVTTWVVLLILIGIAFSRVYKALVQKHTFESVAATIERSFPQLDNHLINYLQFSTDRKKDVFKEAYVKRGVPELRKINVNEMKDRASHRNAYIACLLAFILLAAPCTLRGPTWVNALWRIINPFSNCQPVSLTKIVEINPGNTTILQGNSLVLMCKVHGIKGHQVWLDIKPSDDKKSIYKLGTLAGGTKEEFSYRIVKVTRDTKYRFRAGDFPSPEWFTVKTRPPLALTKLDLSVKPPTYTTLLPRQFDGISDAIEVPQGSKVDVKATYNLPLISASLMFDGQDPVILTPDEDKNTWYGTATIKSGNIIKFVALDTYGENTQTPINFKLMPDRLPAIQILSPKGRTLLPPGNVPNIEFVILDDYGLADVMIERVALGSIKSTTGKVVGSWEINNSKEFTTFWEWSGQRPETGEPLAFRVVAKDNYPLGEHSSKSSTIIFDTITAENAARQEKQTQAKASTTLSKLIELQRENLNNTRKFREVIDVTEAAPWQEATDQQKLIRQLAFELLQNPLKPLGGMTPVVKNLYMEEMLEVITKLDRIPNVNGDEKTLLAEKSISLEETILRKLTYAGAVVDKITYQRKISGLFAMLEAMIKGETKVLALTSTHIKLATEIGETLVNQQDELASDLSEFVKACHREAPVLENSDKVFAELILKVSSECKNKQIKDDMLHAAEKLDNNDPKQALPHEKNALAKLKTLQDMMNKWRVANAEEKLEEAIEALHDAREKIEKLRKLEEKVIEAMRQLDPTKDKADKEEDLMEEEIAEVSKNQKEALLQIAKDLHIFPELSVANELVEDCFAVFEEVEQAKDSEQNVNIAEEIGLLKPELLIEQMKNMEGRIEEMEMWLGDKPEAIAWNAEAFDREELPKMALGALPTEMEDLVGDLLKESKKMAEEADDSATNQGVPDLIPGWEVAEGPTSSSAAQGKSGNQTPDHAEQSGRSNIGREGHALGEAAAGSGTIGKGDKNIEKRMTSEPTQSGQVQVDGEADEKATGGGKQASGSAEEFGMAGGVGKRMDSTAQGSLKGLEALMAKTQSLYVKASLMNIRTESLGVAAHHMHQANDAIASGLPISQVREHQRRAIAALKKAKTELNAGVSDAIDNGQTTGVIEDLVEGGTDEAPATYRELVAEYFKSLSESI